MQNIIKTVLFSGIFTCMSLFTQVHAQQTQTAKLNTTTQHDLIRLNNLWLSYQKHLTTMNQALNSIRKEIDENQKNAKIAVYTRQLEDTKNALNRLVLTQMTANQLRQLMLEHATKYQNVYKLSAVSKPTPNQISMFERLNIQTDNLYQEMQATANRLP